MNVFYAVVLYYVKSNMGAVLCAICFNFVVVVVIGNNLILLPFVFSPDDIGTCWYILLSGSVFIKESMFLPRSRYRIDIL